MLFYKMQYYNIHTHRIVEEDDVIAIYNLKENEITSGEIARHPNLYYSSGIHPWDVDSTVLSINDIYNLVEKEKRIVAIGEVGLDKLSVSSYTRQQEIFEEHIKLGKEANLPLIIHCVKAWDDLIALYKKYKPAKPWIIHGFRGNAQQAEQLAKIGFLFSVGEFYNEESVKVLFPDYLFLETDESPLDIREVYKNISMATGVSTDKVSSIIEQNARSLFLFCDK